MGYYLNNASDTTAHIAIPTLVIGANVGDYIEFKAVANAGNTYYIMCGRHNSTDDNNRFMLQSGSVLLRANSYANALFATGYVRPAVGQVFTIRLTKTGAISWQVHLDGVSIGSANSGATLQMNAFGKRVSGITDSFKGGFYAIEASTDGGATVARYYDASASGGSGTTLPDTVNSANSGTTSGSWTWVYYSSGSTDYSDTLSGVTFTSSGNTLSATASYGSTLNGGAYSSSGNTLAVTRGYSSTLNSATFTSSGGNLSATRGYSSLLNGGSYSYLGNILTSTFSGAAQSFDDAMLGGVYSSSGNTLSSFVGMSSVMLGANFTSAGGSLSSILGYSSNLSGGVYSYSGNRLISTWSGEVTVTIEGYTIMFADDSISALFGADNVSANFELDHVSVRWSN